MTIKKFDSTFDTALWIIFLALCAGSWFLSKKICAPEYEHVENPIVKNYLYTGKNGSKTEAQYEAVWYHPDFSSPRIKLYDSEHDKAYDIKDEYLLEYQSLMPESRYSGFFYRWFWVWAVLFVIISAVATYYLGGAIRDNILYQKIKRDPTFSDVAYFLYTDRVSCRDKAKALIPATIDKYIKDKIPQLSQKYSPSFVKLIIQLLTTIRYQNDTNIKFFMSYLENTTDQLSYLKSLAAAWASPQRDNHPQAQQIREQISALRQNKYVKIETSITPEDVSAIVTRKLNALFTEIMGSEVFSFDAYESKYLDTVKMPGNIFVTIETENTPRTFTWSGSEYSDCSFPGIDVRMTIYHYVNREKNILWDRLLDAKCTYKAEDLNVTDLYDNMITKTLESFDESLKK